MRINPFYDAWLFLTGNTDEHRASGRTECLHTVASGARSHCLLPRALVRDRIYSWLFGAADGRDWDAIRRAALARPLPPTRGMAMAVRIPDLHAGVLRRHQCWEKSWSRRIACTLATWSV